MPAKFWRKRQIAMGKPEVEPSRSDIKQSDSVEPVAWIEHHKGGDNLVWDEPNKGTPLYTPCEWVGLTDEEILAECESVPDYDIGNRDLIHFAQAIEAKLREKNSL